GLPRSGDRERQLSTKHWVTTWEARAGRCPPEIRRAGPGVRRPALGARTAGPRRSGPRGTAVGDRPHSGRSRRKGRTRTDSPRGVLLMIRRTRLFRPLTPRPVLVAACAAGALLLGACGSSTPAATDTSTAAATTSAAASTSEAPTAGSAGSASSAQSSETSVSMSETAASTGTSASSGLDDKGCITDFDADTDYYPVKSTLDHATNFTLSYHKSYQVLTVVQPEQGAKPESYVLVKCGAPKPELTGDLAEAQVVTTPVQSLFSASTSHLPNLVALDQLDVLTGVASKSFISEKQVLDRVADPDVVEFAPASTVDAEKVVAAKPDVLITGGYADPAYATIEKAGIPVLADAEWLENDPLGRAEWIKYFAALT